MKKMRTLMMTVSFALFSLTACAVDPDDAVVEDDGVACLNCGNTGEGESADEIEDSSRPPREPIEPVGPEDDELRLPRPGADRTDDKLAAEVDERGLPTVQAAEEPAYCERNEHCESKVCDLETSRCRDYPF